jgi:hypothetical protein
MLYNFPPYHRILIFIRIKLLLSNEGAVDVVGVCTAKSVMGTNQPDHAGDYRKFISPVVPLTTRKTKT